MEEIYQDQLLLENELKNMSLEKQTLLKQSFPKVLTTDILVQKLEDLEKNYGKEEVLS